MFTALTLALMFIPLSGSQTVGQYDAWLDYNDDGKVDMRDIGPVCRAFGTTGDPTKSVRIDSYYSMEWNKTLTLERGQWNDTWISTKGLRKLTMYIKIEPLVWIYTDNTKYGYANATIRIGKMILNQTIESQYVDLNYYIEYHWFDGLCWCTEQGSNTLLRLFDIYFSSMHITISARNPIKVTCLYYITA
jgi:hypothetical protein